MLQRLGLLLAFGLAAPTLYAQPLTSDTLDVDAIVRFVLSGPHVSASAFNTDAYDAAVGAAGTLPQPMVSGTIYPWSMATGAGPRAPAIRVSQAFPNVGVRRARRAAAVATADAVELREVAFRADAAGSAITAFIMVQRARDIRAELGGFLERMKLFEEAATVRYEVGNGPQSDVLLAQIDRGRVEARIVATQSEEDVHIYHLLVLSHLPETVLRASAFDTEMAMPSQSVIDSAATISPTIRALRAGRDAALANVRASQAEKRPTLALHAMYSPMYTMPDDAGPIHAIGAGASLTLPLRRNPLNARVAEARSRLNEYEAKTHVESIHVRAAVQRQLDIIRREREILRRYELELQPQAEVVVESSLSSYVTGQTGFVSLLEAERRRLEIGVETINTRARVREAIATLYRELGQMPRGNNP